MLSLLFRSTFGNLKRLRECAREKDEERRGNNMNQILYLNTSLLVAQRQKRSGVSTLKHWRNLFTINGWMLNEYLLYENVGEIRLWQMTRWGICHTSFPVSNYTIPFFSTLAKPMVWMFDFAFSLSSYKNLFFIFIFLLSFDPKKSERRTRYGSHKRIKKYICMLYSPKLCVPQRINIDNVNIILVRTEVAILKCVLCWFAVCVRAYVRMWV